MSSVTEGLPPVRVLGIGSPFALDCIGWDLLAALQRSQKLLPYLDNQLLLESLDRPGAHLLRYFEGAEYVLLLDAVIDPGLVPGEARRYSIEKIRDAKLLPSSHGFGVQQALSLAQALGQLPKQIEVLGVSIATVEDEGVACEPKNIDWNGTISSLVACLETELADICDLFIKRSVTS